jgi:hypothetical protein
MNFASTRLRPLSMMQAGADFAAGAKIDNSFED